MVSVGVPGRKYTRHVQHSAGKKIKKLPNKVKEIQGMEPLTHCWHGYRDGRLESENGAWVSSEENWKKEPPVAFALPHLCV